MTTPERLRRRQRREEIMLILLGLAVGLASVYFHGQDVEQRQCITDNFARFSDSLQTRGYIAERESRAARIEARATRLESKANNDFYKAAFSATDTSEVFDAYGVYRAALAEVNKMRQQVNRRRERIAKDRAEHPITDFPAGTCD